MVEQQAEMCQELRTDSCRVIKDQNGNHVIQVAIEKVPRKHTGFVMEAMRGQMSTLSQQAFACRVVQRMLEYGTAADKTEIMDELYPVANMLIMDQYGNYVAQNLIQNGNKEDRDKMIDFVMEQLVSFSRHKFASNVVERCIEHGSKEQRTSIKEQLTGVGPDGNGLCRS